MENAESLTSSKIRIDNWLKIYISDATPQVAILRCLILFSLCLEINCLISARLALNIECLADVFHTWSGIKTNAALD
jgi:hypothetical protein